MVAHTDTTAPERAPAPVTVDGGEHGGAGERARRGRVWVGLWFCLPFLAFYAAFLVWPVLAGLWSSFFNRSLAGGESEFLGLANWREMVADPAVWDSLWNTLWFTLLSTPMLVVVGLGMALLTHRVGPRLGWFLRFGYFAPFVLPVTVVTLIWIWIYQPGFGLINGFLSWLGLPEVAWLTDESVAMLSIVLTTVWWTVGFNFLLYLAALQGIPDQLYESASLDGANGWQKLREITLPMLRRTTGLVVMLQLVASLKIFDQVYLMTGGGPNFSTRPIIQYIYETGFTSFRIGYASAVSYMLFAVIIIVSLVQFKVVTPKGDQA